jgi:hypothetical protein
LRLFRSFADSSKELLFYPKAMRSKNTFSHVLADMLLIKYRVNQEPDSESVTVEMPFLSAGRGVHQQLMIPQNKISHD